MIVVWLLKYVACNSFVSLSSCMSERCNGRVSRTLRDYRTLRVAGSATFWLSGAGKPVF